MPRPLVVVATAIALLAPALAPGATAKAPPDLQPFPADIVAIARAWTASAREDLARAGDASWAPLVAKTLDSADAHLADGRVRAAGIEVANVRTSMRFHALWLDVQAAGSNSSKIARTLTATDAWFADAGRSETAFRAKLHALDGNLTSVASIEAALLATDWAMDGVYSKSVYAPFREEVQRGTIDASYVLGLAVASVGAKAQYEMASDLLDAAIAREGVLPRILDEKWHNLTIVARVSAPRDFQPPSTRPYDLLAIETETTGEDLLAVGAFFAALRSQRVTLVQTQFGDAASRGIGALADLTENVNRSLETSALPAWRAAGYDGLLTLDGVDSAIYTRDEGDKTLASLARAWIAIEHPRTVAQILGQVSSERKEVDVSGTTDGAFDYGAYLVPAGLGLAGVAVAGTLILLGRRK